jgi:hypothetical protein
VGGRAIQRLLHASEKSSDNLLDIIGTHISEFERNNCAMALNR